MNIAGRKNGDRRDHFLRFSVCIGPGLRRDDSLWPIRAEPD